MKRQDVCRLDVWRQDLQRLVSVKLLHAVTGCALCSWATQLAGNGGWHGGSSSESEQFCSTVHGCHWHMPPCEPLTHAGRAPPSPKEYTSSGSLPKPLPQSHGSNSDDSLSSLPPPRTTMQREGTRNIGISPAVWMGVWCTSHTCVQCAGARSVGGLLCISLAQRVNNGWQAALLSATRGFVGPNPQQRVEREHDDCETEQASHGAGRRQACAPQQEQQREGARRAAATVESECALGGERIAHLAVPDELWTHEWRRIWRLHERIE
eukprot:1123433-Prymnesium_polylepis.1